MSLHWFDRATEMKACCHNIVRRHVQTSVGDDRPCRQLITFPSNVCQLRLSEFHCHRWVPLSWIWFDIEMPNEPAVFQLSRSTRRIVRHNSRQFLFARSDSSMVDLVDSMRFHIYFCFIVWTLCIRPSTRIPDATAFILSPPTGFLILYVHFAFGW